MVTVTPKAAEKLLEVFTKENKQYLRVAVMGGGCSGFQYHLELETEQQPADHLFEINGVKIIVDRVSINYVKGAEIDFVDQLTGGGFVVKNPTAKSTCGCGSSFKP